MTAVLILHTKEIRGNEIVEVKVWQVPRSKACPQGVKYSIAYIRDGKRFKQDLRKLRGSEWDEDQENNN
jgi:CxxC motif-containing protein